MGKKADRKGTEDESRKKRRKGGADDRLDIAQAVRACPPGARLQFEWVVGNGLGERAVQDALEAHQRALGPRSERAEREARGPASGCREGCRGETLVLGPLHGRQHWQIDTEADPPRATTWSWVGFAVVCDCSPVRLS